MTNGISTRAARAWSLVLSSTSVLACAAPEPAGDVASESAAIFGGNVAPSGAPYNAVGRVSTSALTAGSAVLVTPTWVLTNAHVLAEGAPAQVDVFFGKDGVSKYTWVRSGTIAAEGGVKIDRVIVPTREGCSFASSALTPNCAAADLALLHLSQPVGGIQPLHPAGVGSTPACPQTLAQGAAQAIGFGATLRGGGPQAIAYVASTPWSRLPTGSDQLWRTPLASASGPLPGDSGGAIALVDGSAKLCGLLQGGEPDTSKTYLGQAVALDTGFARDWLEAALWDASAQRFAGERCGVTTGTDADGDRVPDACDNCPDVSNWSQEDRDSDGVGDVCDNCASIANRDQVNSNLEREVALRGAVSRAAQASDPNYLTKYYPGDACDQPLAVLHADSVAQLDEVVGGEANPRRVSRKFARGVVDSCLPVSSTTNAPVWVNNRVVVEGVRGELGATDRLEAVAGRTMLTHCASSAINLSEAERPLSGNCTRSPSNLRSIPFVFARSTSHRHMRVGTAGAASTWLQAENPGEIKTTHDFRTRANAATVNDLRWAYWKDLPGIAAPRTGDAEVWRGVQLAWVRNFGPVKMVVGADPSMANAWVKCASTGLDANLGSICGGPEADAQAALRQTASLVAVTESAPAVDYSRCRPRQFLPVPDLIARDCPQCSIKPVAVLDTVSNPGIVFSNLGVNPAPPVLNPSSLSAMGSLLALKPATGLLSTFAARAPAGALLAPSGDVARVAFVDETSGAVRYEASPAAVSSRISGIPQSPVAAMDEATGRLVMALGTAQSARAGLTQVDLRSGARSFRALSAGSITTPEVASFAPGTASLFVVDRTSPGERRLVRVGEALEATGVSPLPASGVITLAPEAGGRLAVGWSNAGAYGAALLDVRNSTTRVLAVATGRGQLDVAPRASEKGLEFVASASAAAEKRRVVVPLATSAAPLVNLDSLLRNGR